MTAAFERGPALFEPEAGLESTERQAAMSRLRDQGLVEVAQRFGEQGSEERLDFHGPEHTAQVIDRVGHILSALRTVTPDIVSEQDMAFGEMVAAWHDVVQVSRRKADGSRERLRGFYESDNPALPAGQVGNERASWQELEGRMDRAIFSAEDMTRGSRALAATFPQFAFEAFAVEERAKIPGQPERGLCVFQPYLEKDLQTEGAQIDRVELALGLADLGTFGMEADSQVVMQEGDAEFRELHPEWVDLTVFNTEQRCSIAKAMLGWVASQVGFAAWQRIRFEQNIAVLAAQEQVAVRELFPCFEQNIAAVDARARELQGRYGSVAETGDEADFLKLAAELGYSR